MSNIKESWKIEFSEKKYTYWHCLFVYRVFFQARHRTPEHYTDFVCILNLIWHVTWIVFPHRGHFLIDGSRCCFLRNLHSGETVHMNVRWALSRYFSHYKSPIFLNMMLFYLLMFLLRRNCQKLAKWWISSYLQVTLAIFKAGLYQNRNKYWIISTQKHRKNKILHIENYAQNFELKISVKIL